MFKILCQCSHTVGLNRKSGVHAVTTFSERGDHYPVFFMSTMTLAMNGARFFKSYVWSLAQGNCL